ATLGPSAVATLDLLEKRFLSWASECRAERRIYPPLMAVADLEKLDYFRNFPHLGLVVSRVHPDHLLDLGKAGMTRISETHSVAGEYVLPTAACYNIYVHLRNGVLREPFYVTTVTRCFRNEERYEGLTRLWGFTMREVVCVGSSAHVREHLEWFKSRILQFA